MSLAHDVLPIVWTDYTYDLEHGIAEGIPLAFLTQRLVPGGESLFYCYSVHIHVTLK